MAQIKTLAEALRRADALFEDVIESQRQAMLDDGIDDDDIVEHLNRMRQSYRDQRGAMADWLENEWGYPAAPTATRH